MDRGPGAVKRPSSPSRFPERLAQVRREVHSHHCPRLLPVGESPTGYGVVFVETPAGAVLSLRRWQPGCDSTVGWPQDCAALSLRSILEGKTYLLSPAGLGGQTLLKHATEKRLSAAVTGLRAGVLEFPNNRTAISWKCRKGNTFEYILMNQMELPDCLPPW